MGYDCFWNFNFFKNNIENNNDQINYFGIYFKFELKLIWKER